MKFSYSWLKQLVDINLPADKLAEFLSLHAFETEVVNQEQVFEGIVVAKVTKVDKHPNADRLRIIELSDGKHKIGPVVCGAWNFDTGAIVALALPGSSIPHDQHDPEGKPFILSKATIRGVESQGMICSAKELGLSSDGAGILLLDSKYKLGQRFSYKENSQETIFDITPPANRPDLISYRGVAWEIAALTGRKYLVPKLKSQILNLKSNFLKVRISDAKLCQKYLAARLTNVKVGPTPKFIQDRLMASGLRAINNVVDITNYVMLEVGQPLHAFDATKVVGSINVRKAYVQESLATLDGVKRKLTPDMLVIADAEKVLAIAGVMGGADSAVSDKTTELILESANFNSVSIRRTARSLGLRTEASSRYEKSLPVALTNLGLEYACELLVKYADAKVVDFTEAKSKETKRGAIKADPEAINKLLGTEISTSEQKKILSKFGFNVKLAGARLIVESPPWRTDVSIWQDLAEDIVRYKGLDTIKPRKAHFVSSAYMTDPIVDLRTQVSNLLVGMGFDEAYTYSFVPESFVDKYQLDKKTLVEVENPMSNDQKYLRSGIGMNYEKLIKANARYVDTQNIFEFGNVYRRSGDNVEEHTNLFLLSFAKKEQPATRLIGSMRELFGSFGIALTIKQIDEESGEVLADGEDLGPIRAVNEKLKWAAAELNFEKLIKHIKPTQYKTPHKFPSRELDVTILVSEGLPWLQIKDAIKDKVVAEVRLIDDYQGKNITIGKKSLTFRIVYQIPERTLTDEEVDKIHQQILINLKSKFGAQISE